MDKPPPDDFDPYGRGDMRIEGTDIPKSTLVLATAMWGVLVALGSWTLSMVSETRAEVKGQQAAIIAVNARVDRVEQINDEQSRIIQELQRARR